MDLSKIGIRNLPPNPSDLKRRTIIDVADCTSLGVLRGTTYLATRVNGRVVELEQTGQVLNGPYDPELDPGHAVLALAPYIDGGVERRGYRVARLLPAGTWQRLADEYERLTGQRPPAREVVENFRLEW